MENKLLFFYGLDCPHCVESEKIVDDLIVDGFDIKKLEIWYNEDNDRLLEELDNGDNCCGGIPFFLNQKTGKTICGDVGKDEIRAWAEGK
ncbi:MAG: hypothetical protein PHT84_01590 [Candidatus Pacebacteria bacterium]|nr:hypothetical protein [Candidatus Paceibacterota bacterium]